MFFYFTLIMKHFVSEQTGHVTFLMYGGTGQDEGSVSDFSGMCPSQPPPPN